MILAKISEIHRDIKVADRHSRYLLGKLAEETRLSWKEVNKIAKEVVGREFGDASKLTMEENRRVREFIRVNMRRLMIK